MSLETYSVKQYADSIGVRHLTLENAAKILKPSIAYSHIVTCFEFIESFYETIFVNSRSNQLYDFVINRGRFVVEADHTVNAARKPDAVIGLAKAKTGKDVTGKQRLDEPSRVTGEFVVFGHTQLRIQHFKT